MTTTRMMGTSSTRAGEGEDEDEDRNGEEKMITPLPVPQNPTMMTIAIMTSTITAIKR
jgi:hypothetical protein